MSRKPPETLKAITWLLEILQHYHDTATCEAPGSCGHCLAVRDATQVVTENGYALQVGPASSIRLVEAPPPSPRVPADTPWTFYPKAP